MTPTTLPPLNLAVLLAGLALAALPHVLHLPLWASATAAILFLWRLAISWKGLPLPSKFVTVTATIAAIAGDILTYRTIFGRDAGVTLLVLLLALKLMELRSQREIYVVTFLSYFLALTNFFYSQTIPTAVLMLFTVYVVTAGLIGFNAPTCRPVENLRTAGALFLQAGPVMLLLFFLFPRVDGPFWGMPQDAFAGVTGLSDTMSPGSISRLSQSDAIAFRVKFDDKPPPRPRLYWRGPVFWEFDGVTWRPGGLPLLQRGVKFESLDAPVDYEITLEPHNRRWMFALDLPGRLPPRTRISIDYVLLSVRPIRTRMRYQLRSYPSYRATAGADPEDIRLALSYPRGFNPRAQRLAREWRRTLGNDEAILLQAIDFLRTGRYGYTLQPPLLGANSVDEFLFDTKEGFCEHFSSGFVFLMRAAGVPARIVTGYQGGEMNPVDGYMVVRQADAHAWAEVWLGNRGWVRVDPTAVAIPLRVNAGIAAAAPQSAPLLMRTRLNWLRTLRDNWDALGNKWNQWVLGYNPDRQREMMSWFGVRSPSWQSLAMALFWSVGSVIGIVALWLFARYRTADPTQRVWLAFCRKLGRAGVVRSKSEGPLAFGARAAARLPERADAVHAIAGLYVELRYGKDADKGSVARLRSLVRAFHP
ncbi:MAG: hypothetical protein A3H32_13795 [Betaproteobacteria bacterium RIFCSPLOWO2_02_FULL_63_19]|nr:MAG: hypothetical protein A3H32_13795 [Betaproteobacteria bacterium RIFCSPLOWO2_02_FULL_63_19]